MKTYKINLKSKAKVKGIAHGIHGKRAKKGLKLKGEEKIICLRQKVKRKRVKGK